MHPWIVGIGTGTVVLILTILVDLITAVKIFSTIKKVSAAICKAVLGFLNYNLKVWWVLISVAVVVFGLYLFDKYIEYEQKQKENNKPPFLEYTHDLILDYEWKWVWERKYDGTYSVEMLHPVCKKCATPLSNSDIGFGRYICLRCKAEYRQPLPREGDVKMMIRDNVRRKYYPNE